MSAPPHRSVVSTAAASCSIVIGLPASWPSDILPRFGGWHLFSSNRRDPSRSARFHRGVCWHSDGVGFLAPRRRAELTPASVLGPHLLAGIFFPPPPNATGPGTLQCPARLGISDQQATSIKPRAQHVDGVARSSRAHRQRVRGRLSPWRGRSRGPRTRPRFRESMPHR